MQRWFFTAFSTRNIGTLNYLKHPLEVKSQKGLLADSIEIGIVPTV